ncbi:flagellar biosynthesis protein FlhB [Vibrio owensii]|uniref:flagellar biosynthesis protein FlhB n=1 Tax=Vibrio owensii TaxID=696485 RepID=UPI0018F124A6|nr:flagellar biosynthesis protein FlhB [Vibrio owensii]
MSDNKTEQATEGRLKKASDEGKISRSKDLGSAASLICAVVFLSIWTDTFLFEIERVFRGYFTFNKESLNHNFDHHKAFIELLKFLIYLLTPLALIQAVVIPSTTFLVGGIHFNFVQIKPKFSKINPIEGVKRIFSTDTLVELFKSIFKISFVFLAFYLTIAESTERLTALTRANIESAGGQISSHLLGYSSVLIGIIVIFSLLDAGYQKYSFSKKMRMTKQEIKDEHKENEGRPEVKQRVRQIQMANAKRSVNKTVPEADLILTNPTHYSVAIKYDPSKAEAPFVVAKGVDDMALYIREIANKSNVPIFEYPPLARAVYNTTAKEQMIPNQLFVAVAEVLGYIKQLDAHSKNKASKPTPPTNLDVPKEFY